MQPSILKTLRNYARHVYVSVSLWIGAWVWQQQGILCSAHVNLPLLYIAIIMPTTYWLPHMYYACTIVYCAIVTRHCEPLYTRHSAYNIILTCVLQRTVITVQRVHMNALYITPYK